MTVVTITKRNINKSPLQSCCPATVLQRNFQQRPKYSDIANFCQGIALYLKDDSLLKHHKSMKRQSVERECGFICILTVQAEVSYLCLKF